MVNVDQELDAIVKQEKAAKRGGNRGGRGRGPPRNRSRSARRGSQGKRASSFGRNGGFTGRQRSLSTSDLRGACKIMISNLDFGVSERDMKELFQDYGGVRKVNFHYDRNGRSLGSCEVVFDRSSLAQRARRQYHGVPLDGRAMEIEIVGIQASPPRRPARSPRRGPSGPRSGPRRGAGPRRGGGGGRPRSEKKENLTAEELDKQLDQYLTSGSKGED